MPSSKVTKQEATERVQLPLRTEAQGFDVSMDSGKMGGGRAPESPKKLSGIHRRGESFFD
ncbi:MAG: hypothetical protein KGI04_01735 [Candidatus Micrarchaeota archaeon]|nr:hypothetical protein [Candidatus Micrarchaeota archaeon]